MVDCSFIRIVVVLASVCCYSLSVAGPLRTEDGEVDEDAKVEGEELDKNVLHYFTIFGYLPKHQMVTPDYFKKSVKNFQRIANINQTGVLDNDTMTMMARPRCGIPDVTLGDMDINRFGGVDEDLPDTGNSVRKRYALYGTRWHQDKLSYCVVNYPRSQKTDPTPAERDAEKREFDVSVATAIKKWTSVIPLEIENVDCSKNPEIRIRFEEGYHNDRFRFDGKGGVLAHAFFPSKRKVNPHPVTGDVHLDLDEDWVNEGARKGTCFPYVFTHELGHSLGLTHSSEKNSLMWPFYIPCYEEIRLQQDDIDGIQAIYGVPVEKKSVSKEETFHESKDLFTSTREAQSYCTFVGRELCSRKDLQSVIEAIKDLKVSDWFWVRDGLPTKAKIDSVLCQKLGDAMNAGCFYDKLLISTDVGDWEGEPLKAICCNAIETPAHRESRKEDVLCSGVFDAMVRLRAPLYFDHDRLYTIIFKDDYAYAFDVFGMAEGFPAKISTIFPSFKEQYVCSALALPRGLEINFILFGRKEYYVYDVQKKLKLLPGYPKPFSLWGLKGLTECPSIVYPLDDEIHFVRKSQVWKYTGFGSGVSPTSMEDEILTLPNFNWSSIVSASSWKPGSLFFFNNKGDYYYSRDRQFLPGYPKDTAKAWFHFCP